MRFLRKPTSARPATSQPLPLMRWIRLTNFPSAVQQRPIHYNRDRLLEILTFILIIIYCSTWAEKMSFKLTEILTGSQINVGIFISMNSVQLYQYLLIYLVYRARFSLKFMGMNFSSHIKSMYYLKYCLWVKSLETLWHLLSKFMSVFLITNKSFEISSLLSFVRKTNLIYDKYLFIFSFATSISLKFTQNINSLCYNSVIV